MPAGGHGTSVRRHLWLVVAFVLAGAALGTAARAYVGAGYTSTAAVLVQPIGMEPTELANGRTSAEVNLDTEAQLVTSAVVATGAARRVGGAVSAEQMAQRVSVSVPANTSVLRISYDAATPSAARRGASAFAQAYLANRRNAARQQASAQSGVLQHRAAELRDRLSEVSETARSAVDDPSDQALARSEQELLLTQLADINSRLDEAVVAPSDPGRVITPAAAPTAPSGLPPVTFPLSGALLGLLAGLGAGVLRDRRARTVRGPADVDEAGSCCLAVVPVAVAGDGQTSAGQQPYAPTLRRLQARLRGQLGDWWVLVVAGASAGSAGGYLAVRLAESLARSGADVLFVGADPGAGAGVGELSDLRGPGLAELLQNECREAGAECEVGPGSSLQVVHPGAHSGLLSDLLHGETLASRVEQWRMEHRYVVVEVAPASLESDLEAVAPVADGVLLAAEAGRTRQSEVADAAQRVAGVNARLLGVAVLEHTRRRPVRASRVTRERATGPRRDTATAVVEPDVSSLPVSTTGGER